MSLAICKEYKWEASHQLPNHKGKCARLHGHSYRVEIELQGDELNHADGDSSEGMLLDFGDMDEVMDPLIFALDHWHLNDLPFLEKPTTAEHVVLFFVDRLLKVWPYDGSGRPSVHRVRVWETAKSYAEWRE